MAALPSVVGVVTSDRHLRTIGKEESEMLKLEGEKTATLGRIYNRFQDLVGLSICVGSKLIKYIHDNFDWGMKVDSRKLALFSTALETAYSHKPCLIAPRCIPYVQVFNDLCVLLHAHSSDPATSRMVQLPSKETFLLKYPKTTTSKWLAQMDAEVGKSSAVFALVCTRSSAPGLVQDPAPAPAPAPAPPRAPAPGPAPAPASEPAPAPAPEPVPITMGVVLPPRANPFMCVKGGKRFLYHMEDEPLCSRMILDQSDAQYEMLKFLGTYVLISDKDTISADKVQMLCAQSLLLVEFGVYFPVVLNAFKNRVIAANTAHKNATGRERDESARRLMIPNILLFLTDAFDGFAQDATLVTIVPVGCTAFVGIDVPKDAAYLYNLKKDTTEYGRFAGVCTPAQAQAIVTDSPGVLENATLVPMCQIVSAFAAVVFPRNPEYRGIFMKTVPFMTRGMVTLCMTKDMFARIENADAMVALLVSTKWFLPGQFPAKQDTPVISIEDSSEDDKTIEEPPKKIQKNDNPPPKDNPEPKDNPSQKDSIPAAPGAQEQLTAMLAKNPAMLAQLLALAQGLEAPK